MRNGMEQTRSNQNMVQGIWARLTKSNFWQAAFVRPFADKNNWKKVVGTLLAYAFGVVFLWGGTASLIDDAMRHPVTLDKMDKNVGVLTMIRMPKKGTPTFSLSTSDGRDIRYIVSIYQAIELEKFRNSSVTVWSQDGFHLIWFAKFPYEIMLNDSGKHVFRYEKNRQRFVDYDEQDHWWQLGGLMFGFFLITRPWWKHRKSVSQTHYLP